MESKASDDGSAHSRQLGRTLGIGVYAVVMAAFTVVCSVQICLQVWAPRIESSPFDCSAQICLQVWAPRIESSPFDCSAGTLSLAEAIDAARLAAADEPDEQAALAKFRGALAPVWKYRPALNGVCASNPEALRHLRAIDRLRYAEEHAVRYAAVDLAERRHEVERLITSLKQSSQRTL